MASTEDIKAAFEPFRDQLVEDAPGQLQTLWGDLGQIDPSLLPATIAARIASQPYRHYLKPVQAPAPDPTSVPGSVEWHAARLGTMGMGLRSREGTVDLSSGLRSPIAQTTLPGAAIPQSPAAASLEAIIKARLAAQSPGFARPPREPAPPRNRPKPKPPVRY